MLPINVRSHAKRFPGWRWLLILGVLSFAAAIWGGLLFWGRSQLQAAYQASASRRFDEAQQRLHTYLAIWPGDCTAHLLAARVCRAQGKYAQAKEHLCLSTTADELAEDVQLEWSLLRAETGAFPEFELQLRTWIDDGHARSNLILETLVCCLVRESRYRTAVAYLQRWLHAEPENAAAHFWQGLIHESVGMPEQAMADYSRALELDAGHVESRKCLVRLRMETKDYATARPDLKILQNTAPDDATVWMLSGMDKLHQGEADEADRFFAKVLTAHPTDAMARYHRGLVSMQLRRAQDAERWLRLALREAPDMSGARYTLYLCLLGQPERRAEAAAELAAYKESLQRTQRLTMLLKEVEEERLSVAPLMEAVEILLHRRQQDAARQCLQRVLLIEPGHPKARNLLSEVLQGSHKEQ